MFLFHPNTRCTNQMSRIRYKEINKMVLATFPISLSSVFYVPVIYVWGYVFRLLWADKLCRRVYTITIRYGSYWYHWTAGMFLPNTFKFWGRSGCAVIGGWLQFIYVTYVLCKIPYLMKYSACRSNLALEFTFMPFFLLGKPKKRRVDHPLLCYRRKH